MSGPNIHAEVSGKNRVEDLFIWKISEELKLSVKEEKEITNLIKDLNDKKAAVSEQIQKIIFEMAKSPEKNKKLLLDYRLALKRYNDISIEELDRLQKILSAEKSTQYFVVKSDLSQKIRSVLAVSSDKQTEMKALDKKKETGPLPDPKIIEEQ